MIAHTFFCLVGVLFFCFFAHTKALIQSADRETRQTTSITASELIGTGGRGVVGGGSEGISRMSSQFAPFFTTYRF